MVYASKAGYVGGLILLFTAFLNFFLEKIEIAERIFNIGRHDALLFYILICFIIMLLYEWWAVNRFKRNLKISDYYPPKSQKSILYLLKSSMYRVFAIGILFSLAYIVVQNHYYFQNPSFNITRTYFQYLLYGYWIGGIPYCFYTLKNKGGSRYELNDYGVLLMISYRALFKQVWIRLRLRIKPVNKAEQFKAVNFLKNRRVRKVYLVFLVNFFFLTLMTKFFAMEYGQFHSALSILQSAAYAVFNDTQRFHAWYLLFYHLIFYIDVGVAIIGYTIASRWLNNRTTSVDMTIYGWFVVLLCYPPMNAGFTDHFIGYGRLPTQDIITSEIVKMVLMSLILFSFTIYVWATLALGFKFSNLTNRGIISHGPYRFFRHPAYATKNLAWWLDNTQVLSNIWASAALLVWNVIYMLRGITEENHLMKDVNYRHYMQQVTSRFIPKWPNKKSSAQEQAKCDPR